MFSISAHTKLNTLIGWKISTFYLKFKKLKFNILSGVSVQFCDCKNSWQESVMKKKHGFVDCGMNMELGSLRNTPIEGTPPTGVGPMHRQLTLFPTPNTPWKKAAN